MLGEALVERATSPAEVARGVRGAVPRPAPGRARRRSTPPRRPAPSPRRASPPRPPRSTSRSAPTGASRRCSADLAELKRIKNAAGGTVNDVVLAAVTGALGRYLRAHGHSTHELELRAMVPISVRADDEHGALGNRVSSYMAPLPVWCDDPARAPAAGQRDDGRPEAVQAGGRRDADDRARRLRPADDRRPGGAAAVAPAVLQPRRHQHPRPAVPALPARPRAPGDLSRWSRWPSARRSASGS